MRLKFPSLLGGVKTGVPAREHRRAGEVHHQCASLLATRVVLAWCRVWGLGFGDWGVGFRVWGLGFWVEGLRFGV